MTPYAQTFVYVLVGLAFGLAVVRLLAWRHRPRYRYGRDGIHTFRGCVRCGQVQMQCTDDLAGSTGWYRVTRAMVNPGCRCHADTRGALADRVVNISLPAVVVKDPS